MTQLLARLELCASLLLVVLVRDDGLVEWPPFLGKVDDLLVRCCWCNPFGHCAALCSGGDGPCAGLKDACAASGVQCGSAGTWPGSGHTVAVPSAAGGGYPSGQPASPSPDRAAACCG